MRVAGLVVEDPVERSAVGILDVLFPEGHRLEPQTFEDKVLEHTLTEATRGRLRAGDGGTCSFWSGISLPFLRMSRHCWARIAKLHRRKRVGKIGYSSATESVMPGDDSSRNMMHSLGFDIQVLPHVQEPPLESLSIMFREQVAAFLCVGLV